jgi:transglutaminase-like putative cysteine protease
MTWRIAVRHSSSYRYEGPVTVSYNEARLTPSGGITQTVLDTAIEVNPQAQVLRYVDYWGSVVHAFDVGEPHEELVVTASSLVETSRPATDGPDGELTWHDLEAPLVQDRFAELLAATTYAPFDEELAETAAQLRRGCTPRQFAEAVSDYVHSTLRYEPGTTEVYTSAMQAWRQGSGVCQDFAHLSCALMRQHGVPARYVSGYLHPDKNPEVGKVSTGASHAWVEVWLGTFVPLDPTNGDTVAERHVTVARGRDYADVPPLRGVYHGAPLCELEVTVELTRTA